MLAKDLISATPEVLRAQPTATSEAWLYVDASKSAAEMCYTVMSDLGLHRRIADDPVS
ncbi:hypothetical protein G5V57_11960 [Nordella sp. HKS 07]|uniref:hypothetical protein n=1 Tax=Nordella sp. HKS 07 TaxID=2712222 RepID=UPI0013E1D69B|nr:hypothetical protein [Nordella sp. HKS 07]QIG48375.1 hypothetical protein G5V57_11960 [Nordella sp. HKS 07]